MDVKDLRCFVALYETLNFSRAAARLRIVQSNVSARIRRLEKHLGAKLFYRQPRTSIPSGRARTLYKSAVKIIAALDRLERGARRNRKRVH
jgi:DNA-binding transcriptional LysR family regulator